MGLKFQSTVVGEQLLDLGGPVVSAFQELTVENSLTCWCQNKQNEVITYVHVMGFNKDNHCNWNQLIILKTYYGLLSWWYTWCCKKIHRVEHLWA